VAAHLNDPAVRLVESNEDTLLYPSGHIPGAVHVDWTTDLNDPLRRDYITREGFQALMSRIGATRDTTVVFYGDKNNWWAAYAYWFFRYMGHDEVKIMDGGRRKWEEEGREMTRDVPQRQATTYTGAAARPEFRAFRDEVVKHIGYKGRQKVGDGGPLVDVRSPGEYSGELLHMPDYPQEGAMRGGHIPGAANIPWAQAVAEDGTFKPASELKMLYEGKGITADKDVVVYCRIGERSSHTWFVLHELLGYENVRNYDGSWTEWGNVIGVPIER
jgi:thiosulfate/3-mercaptopyruvate sulfurtransferase